MKYKRIKKECKKYLKMMNEILKKNGQELKIIMKIYINSEYDLKVDGRVNFKSEYYVHLKRCGEAIRFSYIVKNKKEKCYFIEKEEKEKITEKRKEIIKMYNKLIKYKKILMKNLKLNSFWRFKLDFSGINTRIFELDNPRKNYLKIDLKKYKSDNTENVEKEIKNWIKGNSRIGIKKEKMRLIDGSKMYIELLTIKEKKRIKGNIKRAGEAMLKRLEEEEKKEKKR